MAHIVLVNGHFVDADKRAERELVEGDTVSVWPPVAGG
jgi:sulfur carrier protein ThiS